MEYLRRKLCLLAGSILLTCAAWGQTLPTDSITKDPEAWYIHFKTGKSNLDLDYNGNRGTLQRCIDRVQEIIDKMSTSSITSASLDMHLPKVR